MSHLLHYLPTTLIDGELIEYKLIKYQQDYIIHLIKLLINNIRKNINIDINLEHSHDLVEKLGKIECDFKKQQNEFNNIYIHKL